jgi:hypothetical protein
MRRIGRAITVPAILALSAAGFALSGAAGSTASPNVLFHSGSPNVYAHGGAQAAAPGVFLHTDAPATAPSVLFHS